MPRSKAGRALAPAGLLSASRTCSRRAPRQRRPRRHWPQFECHKTTKMRGYAAMLDPAPKHHEASRVITISKTVLVIPAVDCADPNVHPLQLEGGQSPRAPRRAACKQPGKGNISSRSWLYAPAVRPPSGSRPSRTTFGMARRTGGIFAYADSPAHAPRCGRIQSNRGHLPPLRATASCKRLGVCQAVDHEHPLRSSEPLLAWHNAINQAPPCAAFSQVNSGRTA